MNDIQFVVLLVLLVLMIFGILAILYFQNKHLLKQNNQLKDANILLKEVLIDFKKELEESVNYTVRNLGQMFQDQQDKISKIQLEKLDIITNNLVKSFDTLQTHIRDSMDKDLMERSEFNKNLLDNQKALREEINKTLVDTNMQTELKLENIRKTLEQSIRSLQEENSKKLDQMRDVVDEKLQKTLEERLSKSFSTVSERLEAVHKGLGEMQSIATSVGDLKKVLSNIKTRGTLGEIQLQNIIEEIMSRSQYEMNFETKKGSGNQVEFAVKLPGPDKEPVYLPIDSKFPLDKYHKLLDAYDGGNNAEISAAQKELVRALKESAKEIKDKYIDVPYTTEFAIMFLPIEGLYAEAVKLDLIGILQREYKINIAGPTTLTALLNSLQMGFRTLAIQEKSKEVWEILEAVKTEFFKFGKVLTKAQEKINSANKDLDELVGTRTRAIQRKLRTIGTTDELKSVKLLELDSLNEDIDSE